MEKSNVATQNTDISYVDLLQFFLPVAVSTMIMMSTHSIINSALARTTGAEAAIAAYAVAKSISMMCQSPVFSVRRLCVTLFTDKESYNSVTKVAYNTFFISIGIMLIIGFTPINKVIFVNLLGISPELLPETVKTFRIFLIMPFFSVIRSIYQGLITLKRKTYLLTVAVIVRLISMLAVATFITNTRIVSGGAVGAIVLAIGVMAEGLLAFFAGRKFKDDLPDQPEEESVEPMHVKGAWLFFLPLIASTFIWTFGRPSINAGLARTTSPETALASYEVARSFAWILIGSFMRVHQIVLVFVRGCVSWHKVKRFALGLGVLTTLTLLTIAFTPVGEWALINLIGVSEDLTSTALETVAILAFIPVVLAATEMYSGLLMKNKRTPTITAGKIANITTLFVVVYIFGRFFPHLGGMMGGLSLLLGYMAELVVLFWRSRDIIPTDQTVQISAKGATTVANS